MGTFRPGIKDAAVPPYRAENAALNALDQAIRMNAEAKINKSNAWHLSYLDQIPSVIKVGSSTLPVTCMLSVNTLTGMQAKPKCHANIFSLTPIFRKFRQLAKMSM